MEFTFRVQDYMAKHKEKEYAIGMLPYFAGWTEGPDNVKSLIIQRERWQRVVCETLWKYRYMTFNPKYGTLAFLVIPYHILYEALGVFMEVLSLLLVFCGWSWGILSLRTFCAFVGLMVLAQGITSLFCLVAFIQGQKIFGLRYTLYLALLGLLEFFWYRWIVLLARISGTCRFFLGVRDPTQYQRTKRDR